MTGDPDQIAAGTPRRVAQQGTTSYFDRYPAQWSIGRYREVLITLREHGRSTDWLLDIGCGNGNVLRAVRDYTPVQQVIGLDISPAYLQHVRQTLGCETILGSILDPAVAEQIRDRFDYALIGDVLHHLVGSSRQASRRLAQQATANAISAVRPGGRLFIAEPLYYPIGLLPLVFYVKYLVAAILPRRLELARPWLNIGAPVVSYYSDAALRQMAALEPAAEVERLVVTSPRRLGPGLRHARATLVVRRAGAADKETTVPPLAIGGQKQDSNRE